MEDMLCYISKKQTLHGYRYLFDVSLSSPFSTCLNQWRKEIMLNDLRTEEENRIITRRHMWKTFVHYQSGSISTAVESKKTKDEKQLDDILKMMKLSINLAEKNGMHLEPFQLESIRACIASASRRILKHNVHKYKHDILFELGMIEDVGMITRNVNLESSKLTELDNLFRDYSKRFIAVIAPRRNGKSKAGKLFVAVNVVCEESARIVLIAHNLNAVLLYKNELLQLLGQIQELQLDSKEQFNIRSSATEICLEFTDSRPRSYIYFVAGGINVSTTMHFVCYCIVVRKCGHICIPSITIG